MAQFQFPDKILLTLSVLLCFVGLSQLVECCHPNSKELHICLNIYLEKDFPFIETIVKGRKRGRVLLEDTDLHNICRQLTTLHDCYKDLLPECVSYWQVDRYSRLMHVLQETHEYLCFNTTDTLRDLLLYTSCLTRHKDTIAECADTGFSWLTTWKEILRMQVSPVDRCRTMNDYRSCLVKRLQEVTCGQEAARIYGKLMDVWLQTWCNKDSSPLGVMKYLYQPMMLPNNLSQPMM